MKWSHHICHTLIVTSCSYTCLPNEGIYYTVQVTLQIKTYIKHVNCENCFLGIYLDKWQVLGKTTFY